MVNQLDAFWKAFGITCIVFLSGVFMGFWLDSYRAEEIRNEYTDMDISSNDARLQTLYYQTLSNNHSSFCIPAIQENLIFSDRVYQDGLRIDQYEKINKLAPSLIKDKTRYVLLKIQFWLNSVRLKRTCNASYTNLVYFYSHYNTTAQENVQSAVLMDLKNEYGPGLILVPLPLDLNITTIEIIKKQYGIKTTPTILIDEKTVIEGPQTRDCLNGKIREAKNAR
jgi:hypothetical protein